MLWVRSFLHLLLAIIPFFPNSESETPTLDILQIQGTFLMMKHGQYINKILRPTHFEFMQNQVFR